MAEISGLPSAVSPVRSVDRPLVVGEGGAGAGGTGVGAGVRLGQAEASEGAAGDEVGQKAFLLLLAAVGEDRVDAQADPGRQGDADRLIDIAEFLDGDAQAREGAAVGVLEAASELLRHDEAVEAEIAHFSDEVAGEVLVAIPLRDMGLDLSGGELLDDLAEVLVVLAQLEHGIPRSVVATGARPP